MICLRFCGIVKLDFSLYVSFQDFRWYTHLQCVHLFWGLDLLCCQGESLIRAQGGKIVCGWLLHSMNFTNEDMPNLL
jgi:hypothetical protein